MDRASNIEIDNNAFDTCPVCDFLVEKDILEQHVEEHFKHEQSDAKDPKDDDCVMTVIASNTDVRAQSSESCKRRMSESEVDRTSDEMLARVLQEQEREEMEKEKKKEREEFQRLEVLAKKEKLLDSHLSGKENGETCTTGVINHLQRQIKARGPVPNHFIRLCCPTDHFSSGYSDKGWGCGYRNLQMLLSALIKLEHYKDVISKVCENVPSIPVIQLLIENAWYHGFDQQGAAQLGHKLTKTKKWIGATEIAVILNFIGLRAHIVDFHRATATDGTHPELFAWMKRYYSKDPPQTPVYIQHQGHSRLVIGFEEHHTKTRTQYLILFDPSHTPRQMQNLLDSENKKKLDFSLLRKTGKQMKSKQYQLVYVDGTMTETDRHNNKVLSSVRIP